MNVLKEFSATFRGGPFAESTRRVYVSAVKTAFRLSGKTPEECGSDEELLTLLRAAKADQKLPKKLRIEPFLRFLEARLLPGLSDGVDYEPIRTWVTQRIEEETLVAKKATAFLRRDLAMLACLCLAPGKPSPRLWLRSTLLVAKQQGGGLEVKLWGKPVHIQNLAMALLYWDNWRERLGRPDQSRIHRKAWVHSHLLFPNSKGGVLTKHALHNALARLSVEGDGRVNLTPGQIQKAFLQHSGSL
jgi:hypothetical protein